MQIHRPRRRRRDPAPPDAPPAGLRTARVPGDLGRLAAHLAHTGLAARPHLVRRISAAGDGGWEVVHAATGPLPAAAPPAVVRLSGRDVDDVRALLAAAGVGAHRLLGIVRDGDHVAVLVPPGVDALIISGLADQDRPAGAGRADARARRPWRVRRSGPTPV